jgi:putative Mg2+ transporter-C (MgtC) family protein
MTTAATIWVNAAIGMTAGVGAFRVAIAATVVTLIVLLLLPPIEGWFENRPSKIGRP